MYVPRYSSAFSPPRRTNTAGATSPIPTAAKLGSPIKGNRRINCFPEHHIDLASGPDIPACTTSFAEQAVGLGFETPRRFGYMRIPDTMPEILTDPHFLRRTSPTSVLEFERVHEPLPACETTERIMEYIHHYSTGHNVRDPRISFAASADSKDRHHDHQDPRGAVNAARFGVSAGGDAAANHISDGNHPTPQNLRDNPERQAKIKTELCQYYIDGRECPWGVSCNFAHGEHELKFRYSTLLLMESSGQIPNAYTYLCRPCLTFVSTGACPFGRRCTCIHDPRVQGPVEYPSWLPMATSKTNAQIIVDPLAAHFESATHQENPLVPQSIWQHCRPSLRRTNYPEAFEFEDTYAIVCNSSNIPVFVGDSERRPGQNLHEKLSELQKLCIVQYFRAGQHKGFLYSPTHSLRGELCMILQTRYFQLNDVTADDTLRKDHAVNEITFDEYKARNTPWSQSGYPYSPFKVVVAHEVAFAPKGDPSCNFSIWFDEEPVKLEQTQIKRSRRIKQKNKTNIKTGHTRPNSNGALIVRTSPADFRSGGPAIEPFVHMVPAEDNAESNRIIDGMIEHRIDSIVFAMSTSNDGEQEAQRLIIFKRQLQKRFFVLNSFHKLWMWPRREGLDRISYSTQAPPGNAITYSPMIKKARSNREVLHDISNIWQGFVESITDKGENTQQGNKRLPVFHSLGLRSEGRGPVPRLHRANDDGATNTTWKQLLLGQSGQWSIARELYETKMKGCAPARNLPLSTIPFVQN
ncbi:hypothetical protein ACHAWX_004968 [Stephanocyclus meneghinianus]